ncbi:MAG: hypothetical protein OEY64_11545 [Nitrospinota bacterium]|nr:hypothetical protein [Nitrospinota bacterium]
MNIKFFKSAVLSTILSLGLSTTNSHAAITDTNLLNSIDTTVLTDGYDGLVKDAGFGLHFNPGNSGAPLAGGLLPIGFKVTGELGFQSLSSNAQSVVKAAGGSDLSMVPFPKVKIQVGIPFGVDLGYQMVSLGDSIKSTGFEARFDVSSFIPLPILDIAARYHTSSGNLTDDLTVKSTGFDVTLGANLPIIKPYLNLGTMTITGTPSAAFIAQYPLLPDVIKEKEFSGSVRTIGVKLTPLPLFCIFAEQSVYEESSMISVGFGIDF